MQNIVVLLEPPEFASDIGFKAGKMYFNRFCIDEDAGNEISGIYSFEIETELSPDGYHYGYKIKGRLFMNFPIYNEDTFLSDCKMNLWFKYNDS